MKDVHRRATQARRTFGGVLANVPLAVTCRSPSAGRLRVWLTNRLVPSPLHA